MLKLLSVLLVMAMLVGDCYGDAGDDVNCSQVRDCKADCGPAPSLSSNQTATYEDEWADCVGNCYGCGPQPPEASNETTAIEYFEWVNCMMDRGRECSSFQEGPCLIGASDLLSGLCSLSPLLVMAIFLLSLHGLGVFCLPKE